MPKSWSTVQRAAVAVAASIPTGYAWLRWQYPTLWEDVGFIRKMIQYFSTIRRLEESGSTIADVFEKYAAEQPNHPCILYENEMYTYAEVGANANRVARWVTRADPSLKKGDAVCILLHNGPVFAWIWLGLLKTGIISSLLNYNLKPATLLHCMRASDVKKLIFGSEFLPVVETILPELREMKVELWMVNDARLPGLMPSEEVVTMDITTVSGGPFPKTPITSLADNASYIFTSGTTGMPKPANVPHSKIFGGAIFYHFYSQLTPDDVYYIPLPMYHSAALLVAVCGGWYKGATLAISKKFSATRFWDDIRKHNVTIFQYIGELCRYLLAQPKKADDGQYPRPLRIAIGNGIRPEIWEDFQTRFNIGSIFEMYGATEGNFAFVNIDNRVGSIGKYPWPVKKLLDVVEIVDCDYATGEPKRGPDGLCICLPSDTTGLALMKVAEDLAFTGYKGSKEMNEKKMVRNVKRTGDMYFNSGDLLKIDKDGYVFFMDRLGDTFRWKGENVSTMEVSQVLSSFPAILEANVYGVHVPGQEGRAGMAAIVTREGAMLDLSDFYKHVTSYLPDYACPKFLRLVETMDITGTFKHKKTDLVKKGFTPNGDEIYIIEPTAKTYVPMTGSHLQMITSGQSKL